MYRFFKFNKLSGAQKVLLPLLLSRFPLYLRKKSAGCRCNRGYQKNFRFFRNTSTVVCRYNFKKIDRHLINSTIALCLSAFARNKKQMNELA